MQGLNKSYYCGNGNEFFGNEYSKRLEEAYNGILNYKDFDYQIIYSLNAVHNVSIVPSKPFNEQIFYKNEFISKKENLAQVWFEKNNLITEFHSISDYCYLKLLELYPEQSKRFGGPSFSLTIYDKGCFIENHKDGDDDDKIKFSCKGIQKEGTNVNYEKIENVLFNKHKDRVTNKGFRYVNGTMKSYEQVKKGLSYAYHKLF